MTSSKLTGAIADEIDKAIAFQRRWQLISMLAYISSTISTLLCSTGATYSAARGDAQVAAVFSGIATVSIGLEKSLLFREKWRSHRDTLTQLGIMKIQHANGAMDDAMALKVFCVILGDYAKSSPLGGSEFH